MSSITDIRRDYLREVLLESNIDPNPFKQFDKWWTEAIKSEIDEVNAMTLATVDATGNPSARIVLLKGYNEQGFVFFTNYGSHKGEEMGQQPRACLVFFWKELERQIRIQGSVSKVSDAESDEYFNSRPAASRLGAWASPQSQVIPSRETIEENLLVYKNKFEDGAIPRPSHWGGYRVLPQKMEFWQGRPSRLHDRILYTLTENGGWKIDRLAP